MLVDMLMLAASISFSVLSAYGVLSPACSISRIHVSCILPGILWWFVERRRPLRHVVPCHGCRGHEKVATSAPLPKHKRGRFTDGRSYSFMYHFIYHFSSCPHRFLPLLNYDNGYSFRFIRFSTSTSTPNAATMQYVNASCGSSEEEYEGLPQHPEPQRLRSHLGDSVWHE